MACLYLNSPQGDLFVAELSTGDFFLVISLQGGLFVACL